MSRFLLWEIVSSGIQCTRFLHFSARLSKQILSRNAFTAWFIKINIIENSRNLVFMRKRRGSQSLKVSGNYKFYWTSGYPLISNQLFVHAWCRNNNWRKFTKVMLCLYPYVWLLMNWQLSLSNFEYFLRHIGRIIVQDWVLLENLFWEMFLRIFLRMLFQKLWQAAGMKSCNSCLPQWNWESERISKNEML